MLELVGRQLLKLQPLLFQLLKPAMAPIVAA